jgi:outer membrane protein
MNKKFLFIIGVIFLFSLCGQQTWAQDKKVVTIGIVHDGLANSDKILKNLNHELQALLSSKYKIQMPADKRMDSDWSADKAAAYYHQLSKDRTVDIILGFGVLSSSVIAREKHFTKPVIVLGIINPEIYHVAALSQRASGVPNFSYVLFNQSIERDLDTFFRIYPYKNIGIVFFDEIINLNLFSSDSFKAAMEKNNTRYTVIPVGKSINDVLTSLKDVDALYLGHLGELETKEKVRLIEELITRRLPVFGFSVKDTRLGALAAITPEENMSKIIRRIALDIEAVLEGGNLADLPVHLSFEEKLTINMETARRIKFSPDFSILSQAELLNEFQNKNAELLDLKQVMQQAVEANLALKIQELIVKSDEKDVDLAKSKYLPTFTISANGVQIDKNRAEKVLGTTAERTISGKVSLEQVIYSEPALANISIQEHLLTASEQYQEQVKLDIMLEAGEAYFNILAARTFVDLRKENLNRIKKNLEISKQRQTVGFSSPSDVYRWESQLATETKNLIEAKNTLRLTRIQLNEILHNPLDDKYTIKDVLTQDSVASVVAKFKTHVRNPHSLQILTRFLIEEAKRKSTEVQQLNASIAAMERSLISIKRQRYLPVLGLRAEADHVFSRNGAGSDTTQIYGLTMEKEDTQWSVGINASLPLFQGKEISHKSAQTKIELKKLKQQKAYLLQNIEMNVRAKVLDLALSAANLDLSRRSADFAGKSFDMVQDAYSKGAVSIVELTDAQTNRLNAELAAFNSVYDYNKNLLRTQRAMSDFLFTKPASKIMAFSLRFEDYIRDIK